MIAISPLQRNIVIHPVATGLIGGLLTTTTLALVLIYLPSMTAALLGGYAALGLSVSWVTLGVLGMLPILVSICLAHFVAQVFLNRLEPHDLLELGVGTMSEQWIFQALRQNPGLVNVMMGVEGNIFNQTLVEHLVGKGCSLDLIRCLFKHGAKDVYEGYAFTILAKAAWAGHLDIVKFLVTEKNADMNRKTDVVPLTPVAFAMVAGHDGVARWFLEKDECYENSITNYAEGGEWTLLTWLLTEPTPEFVPIPHEKKLAWAEKLLEKKAPLCRFPEIHEQNSLLDVVEIFVDQVDRTIRAIETEFSSDMSPLLKQAIVSLKGEATARLEEASEHIKTLAIGQFFYDPPSEVYGWVQRLPEKCWPNDTQSIERIREILSSWQDASMLNCSQIITECPWELELDDSQIQAELLATAVTAADKDYVETILKKGGAGLIEKRGLSSKSPMQLLLESLGIEELTQEALESTRAIKNKTKLLEIAKLFLNKLQVQ